MAVGTGQVPVATIHQQTNVAATQFFLLSGNLKLVGIRCVTPLNTIYAYSLEGQSQKIQIAIVQGTLQVFPELESNAENKFQVAFPIGQGV